MSTTPTPPNGMVSNTELILRKILGEDVTPLPPNSRVEYYLMLVKDLIAQLQSAVNLRGETTTPLTDNATTNPIMIDGKSYTAIMNDAVIYQSGEFIFDGTKWHELGDLSNLTSLNIGAMTGYSKPSETSAIVVADTLNAAIGKLEKALDLKQSTIDSDHKLSADNVDDSNTTNKFATAAQLDQIGTNKNNISKVYTENGKTTNLIDFDTWANCGTHSGTKEVSGNSVKLTAVGGLCFTYYKATDEQYPIAARIPCSSGDKFVFTWKYTAHNFQDNDKVGIFGNGLAYEGQFTMADATAEYMEYTVPNDISFITFRISVQTSGNSATYSNLQIQRKTDYTGLATQYMPKADSNSILTSKINAITDYTLIKRKPCVCFIFDDGNDTDVSIKKVFDTYGVKCGFAPITIADRYVDYYNEGYSILAHGSSLPQTQTEQTIRTFLTERKEVVENRGIKCFGWVTPSSALDTQFRGIVYDLYDYGFTVYKGADTSNVHIPLTTKSYDLWRSNCDVLSISQCKAIVDECVTNSDMVCFYSHGAIPTADLSELISYCVSNAQVMPPDKCMRYFYTFRANEDSFEPTTAQLAAMNSGITAEDVAQITTNKTNISSCQAFTNNARIDSDRKLYISATEPTGDIPINSTWINGSVIKTYALGDNLCDGVMEQGSISGSDGALIDNANRIRTSNYMLLNSGSYTVNFSPQKRVMCFKYDTSGAYIGRIDSSWNNTPYTFNLDDSYKIKFVVSTDDATPIIPSDITDIMLNTGTSAETYVPYGGSWT